MSKSDALVLLPALLCDSRLFAHQIDAFENQLQVLVPELGAFDNFPDMAAHVLDIAPIRFAVAGNSMGGYLALEIMRQAPERVSHLGLIGTNAHADPAEARDKRLQAIRLAEGGKFDQFIEGYVSAALHPNHVGALGPVMAEMAHRLGPDVLIRHQKAIMARADSSEQLPAIKVPTAVVCGRSDALSPPLAHQRMAGAIPGAGYVEVAACGHLVPIEAPEWVTSALKVLLER